MCTSFSSSNRFCFPSLSLSNLNSQKIRYKLKSFSGLIPYLIDKFNIHLWLDIFLLSKCLMLLLMLLLENSRTYIKIIGELLGLLKVVVVQGKRLVIRDFKSSDPYVVLGDQDVFDKDRFKADGNMGHAYVNLQPLVSAARLRHAVGVSSGEMTLRKVVPDGGNCLVRDSCISCINGVLVQSVWLRLCAVEFGEIELKVSLIERCDGVCR